MTHVPGWMELTLIAFAAYRITRLVGWDSITEPARAKIIKRKKGWLPKLLTCPWCIGWWIALAWWVAWMIEPHWTTVAAFPWALSAIVGLLATAVEP